MNQTQKLSGLRCDTAGMGHISCVFSGSQGPQSHPSPSELTPVTEDLGGRGPGRMGGCFPASKHSCVAQWHLISCDTGAPGGRCKHITLKVTQTFMCLLAWTSLGPSQGGSGEFLFLGGCRALAACAGADQSCHAATSHLGSGCLLHHLQGRPEAPRDRRGGRR